MRHSIALLLALTVPAVAQAQTDLSESSRGYTYFHRVDATLAEHDSSLLKCAQDISSLAPYGGHYNAAAAFGMLGGIIMALSATEERKALAPTEATMRFGSIFEGVGSNARRAALENCMIARGWQVRRLPDRDGKALAELQRKDLRARLAVLVGAPQPEGEVARIFANEAANAANKRFPGRAPGFDKKGSLSVLSLSPGRPVDLPYVEGVKKVDAKLVENPATVESGKTYLVLMLTGRDRKNAVGIAFRREGAGPYVSGSMADGLPDVVAIAEGRRVRPETVYSLVFEVAPGRWRIDSIAGDNQAALSFCLGSPAFDVAEGEIVYAGAFDLGGADLGPQMALGPVQQALTGTGLAERLRPARYENGSRGPCIGNNAYALEVPAAPGQD